MNKKINWGIIASIILFLILVIGGISNSNIKSDLRDTIDSKDADMSAMALELASIEQGILDIAEEAATDAVTEAIEDNLLIDIIDYVSKIGDGFNEILSDRDLNLIDSKIEFIDEDGDDEDFNIDGYVNVKNIVTAINKEDFNEDVYAVVSKDSIEYTIVFEDSLLTENISKDNPLVFDFLGKRIEVVDWDDDEVTLLKAEEVLIKEGESVVVDNTTILLDMVMSGSVYVTVNSESEKINEGDTEKVGGIEVYVSEVLYTEKETRVSMAVLSIGNDVEETVKADDEYEEDSIWNWIISSESGTDGATIGLTLGVDFDSDLDDNDEDDYKPLAYGESICLPNDYVCVEFVGLSDEEYSEYSFDYDESENETEITGEFEVDNEDVDTLVINDFGMYYEDEEGDLQDATNVTVTLRDSELILEYDIANIITIIGDKNITIPMNLSNVDFGYGEEVDEGKYRSIYGSIVEIKDDLDENLEDDKELSILIPEEQIEVSFLVY